MSYGGGYFSLAVIIFILFYDLVNEISETKFVMIHMKSKQIETACFVVFIDFWSPCPAEDFDFWPMV